MVGVWAFNNVRGTENISIRQKKISGCLSGKVETGGELDLSFPGGRCLNPEVEEDFPTNKKLKKKKGLDDSVALIIRWP